jgi:hypothetical protein
MPRFWPAKRASVAREGAIPKPQYAVFPYISLYVLKIESQGKLILILCSFGPAFAFFGPEFSPPATLSRAAIAPAAGSGVLRIRITTH